MVEKLHELLNTKEEKDIKNLIYTFREKEVMLDSDLAELFQVETKKLNQQVKRNQHRFPIDFCFQLSNKETENLRSQNVTAKNLSSKRRYNPYVFTEQGIIALAGVLKSEVADEMCIKISRVFVELRHTLIQYSKPLKYICKIHGELIDFKKYTIEKLDNAFNRIEKLEPKKEILLFDGEWFDAYATIVKLIQRAKESVVLVDPYADFKTLEYLSKRNEGVKLTLYKKQGPRLQNHEVERFKEQYGEITIKEFSKSHNRFLILDSEEVYDLDSSLNSVGNKISTINKIELEEVADVLIKLFK